MDNINMNLTEEKKSKQKKIIAIIFLTGALLLLIGIVAAYYSDVFQTSGNLTSSTLKISGEHTVLLNGTETQLDDINSLDPGDVIVVRGTIENTGNQSAWIREKITFGADAAILPFLSVYNTELTQENFASGTDYTDNLLDLSVDGIVVSANRVINGKGENAQTESGGDYTYIGSNTYQFAITIYFMPSAPNATQNATFAVTVATQGLQFRNNNTAEPNEDAWAVVVAA